MEDFVSFFSAFFLKREGFPQGLSEYISLRGEDGFRGVKRGDVTEEEKVACETFDFPTIGEVFEQLPEALEYDGSEYLLETHMSRTEDGMYSSSIGWFKGKEVLKEFAWARRNKDPEIVVDAWIWSNRKPLVIDDIPNTERWEDFVQKHRKSPDSEKFIRELLEKMDVEDKKGAMLLRRFYKL